MKTGSTAILLSLLAILLASCSSLAPAPTETPIPTITSLPTLTNTPKPTSTATEEPSPVPPTETSTEIPTETPSILSIAGDWRWEINPYWGYFHITQSGNLFSGTLDDEYEGTRGDKIIDGEIIDNSLKFTRDGIYGIQYWEGVVSEANETLIITGRWKEGDSGSWREFTAEKVK